MERTYRIELRHYDSYTGGGCRVYLMGNLQKGCTAGGCGYDRAGTAMSNFLMTVPEYAERIQHLTANYGSSDNGRGHYGLVHYSAKNAKGYTNRMKRHTKGGTSRTDGGCGMSSIKRIAEACKIHIEWVYDTKNSSIYIIEVK